MRMRRTAAVLTSAAALSLSGVAVAAPASAALINANVVLVDVIDVRDNQVIAQVPIGVAAAVCGINAAVLADQVVAGDTTCDVANQTAADAVQRRR